MCVDEYKFYLVKKIRRYKKNFLMERKHRQSNILYDKMKKIVSIEVQRVGVLWDY